MQGINQLLQSQQQQKLIS